jgi:TatD DNase family protein
MFIDTHSHLYIPELSQHIPEAIQNLREHNFSHSIQIGTSIESSQKCIELAKTYDIVRATVGIHPCEAQDLPIEKIEEYMKELENMIEKNRWYIVGFWEIGFDHYHLSRDEQESSTQKWIQIEWFRAQARLAKKYDLPVVIHTRNCSQLTLIELEASWLEKFVIHCFSENWDFAQKICAFWPETKISFTGIITYPKASSVREVGQKIPLDRVMIETDAPYLIPEQLKWTVTYCEPAYSIYVFETLCELRGESPKKIEETLWENSCQFFQL